MKARAATDEALEKIEELLRDSRPVPLTDQVRLNPKQARELLGALREALAAERRHR
jgi:hypothetical protein